MFVVHKRQLKRLLLLLPLVVATGFVWLYYLQPLIISSEVVLAEALKAVNDRDTVQIQMAIRRLQRDGKFESQVIFLRGARALFMDRPDLALREFKAIEPKGKLRIPLLILTGEALYRTADLQSAERCLLRATEEDPHNANAHRWLATAYYDLGTVDKALMHLRQVSEIEPHDFRPHRMRGIIYREFGQVEEAMNAFSKAAELAAAPDDLTEILVSLASVQMVAREFQTALDSLQRCQDTSSVLAARAECWWSLGDPQRAAQELALCEKLGDVPAQGRRLRARMFIEEQKADRAIAILHNLLENDASDDEAEYLLAMAYRLTNDVANSTQHLQKSESLKSLKVELTTLSQRAMLHPDDAVVRDELARVCDKLAMPQMAHVWRTAAAACRNVPVSQKEFP